VPDRKPTPGAGQYSFVDTEEPTQPGTPKPADRWDTMARLLANLGPDERRALLVLADDWYRCDADGRALVGAMAGKLAR
jgi:hypothetical protein